MLDHHRFLEGDPKAVHLFLHAARHWTRKFFHESTRVDSVVQAALLEMTLKLRSGATPEPERLVFWIWGCTNNAVRRELTRMRHAKVVAYDSRVHGRAAVDMSEVLRLRCELEDVERALERCDERIRTIFEDRVRGASYREISEMHQLGEGAARESVSKIRKQLQGEASARDKLEFLIAKAKRAGLAPHRES